MNQKNRRRPSRRVQIAYAKAEELGPIVPAPVTARRADGSPILAEGQVFILPTGNRFHTTWCDTVGNRWDSRPNALFVTRLADVGKREECSHCRGGL
jgi:hypothetical protein